VIEEKEAVSVEKEAANAEKEVLEQQVEDLIKQGEAAEANHSQQIRTLKGTYDALNAASSTGPVVEGKNEKKLRAELELQEVATAAAIRAVTAERDRYRIQLDSAMQGGDAKCRLCPVQARMLGMVTSGAQLQLQASRAVHAWSLHAMRECCGQVLGELAGLRSYNAVLQKNTEQGTGSKVLLRQCKRLQKQNAVHMWRLKAGGAASKPGGSIVGSRRGSTSGTGGLDWEKAVLEEKLAAAKVMLQELDGELQEEQSRRIELEAAVARLKKESLVGGAASTDSALTSAEVALVESEKAMQALAAKDTELAELRQEQADLEATMMRLHQDKTKAVTAKVEMEKLMEKQMNKALKRALSAEAHLEERNGDLKVLIDTNATQESKLDRLLRAGNSLALDGNMGSSSITNKDEVIESLKANVMQLTNELKLTSTAHDEEVVGLKEELNMLWELNISLQT